MNTHFIAGLGSSAGGLDALTEFFSKVTPTGNVSYVVVSHLPIRSSTQLHVLLSRVTHLKVELLSEATYPRPDHIYVLPGALRVTIVGGMLLLRARGRDEVINTAIDEFLFSLAEDQRDKAIAIIFAGMGVDGANGAKKVHENGGLVFAQDPASTSYNTMPLAAIERDDPNAVQQPAALAETIQSILSSRREVPIKQRHE